MFQISGLVLLLSGVVGLGSRKYLEISDCSWEEDSDSACIGRAVSLGHENGLYDFKLLIPSDAAHEWALEMEQPIRMAIKRQINSLEKGKLIAKFVPRGLLTLDSVIWDCKTLVEDPTFDGFEIQLTSDLFNGAQNNEEPVVPTQKQLAALLDFIRSCRSVETLRGQGLSDDSEERPVYLGLSVDANLLDLEVTQSTRLIDTLRELRDDLDSINIAYTLDSPDEESRYYPDIFVGLKSTRPTIAVDTLTAVLGPKVGVELDATLASAEEILKDVCLAESSIKFEGDVTLVHWRGGEGLIKQCPVEMEHYNDRNTPGTFMNWVKASPAMPLIPGKNLRSASRHH